MTSGISLSCLQFFVCPFRWTVVLGQCHYLQSIESIQWSPNILLTISNPCARTNERIDQITRLTRGGVMGVID